MAVLLVDDDQALIAALTAALEQEGHDVRATQDPQAALRLLEDLRPDLILLNPLLADGERLRLLIELRRQSQAVVIMLLGRGDEEARVQGLEFGADDYVTRPSSARELTARIRAHLRPQDGAAPPGPVRLQVGPLALDVATYSATNAGEPLNLTVTEFRLLKHLMTHPGVVVTLDALLREVWGYKDTSITDVVRTAVYRLRQKLRDDPADPQLLRTIAGVGFILHAPPEGTAATDA